MRILINSRTWSQIAQVQIPILLLPGYGVLGKLLNLSHCPHL